MLVNRYAPGDGIMSHTDGPAYTPYVAIVSLGSSTVFDFANCTDGTHELSVVLPARSLLLFEGRAYHEWLHGIEGRKFDELPGKGMVQRETRYSLTIRHVPLALSMDGGESNAIEVDRKDEQLRG